MRKDDLVQPQLAAIKTLAKEPDPKKAIQSVMEHLKAHRKDFHWVGVYILKGDMLHVGPYTGPVTDHVRIPIGKGVCGTAVIENKNQLVDDVASLDNYLACNLETRSEIVVLVRNAKGGIIGQIDIDSTKVKAFGPEDETFLEAVGNAICHHMQALQDRI
jgi:L-methionine (R)-S-oxide reductase